MTDIDELTSEKASVRLKVEVANGGITDSIIGNEPAARSTQLVCHAFISNIGRDIVGVQEVP